MKKTWITILGLIVASCMTCACLTLAACNKTPAGSDDTQSGYRLDFNTVYALAEEAGYTGTLEDLVALFKGKNAYELAVAAGYTGTQAQWLETLVGATGKDGATPTIGTDKHWYIDGIDTGVVAEGKDGRGVDSAEIDEQGRLVITFSDGDTQVLPLTRAHGHEIEAAETVMIEPTCTRYGLKTIYCQTCQEVLSSVVLDKTPHRMNEEIHLPTCSEEGYTLHYCEVCDYAYRDTPVGKLPHTFATYYSYDSEYHWYAALCGHTAAEVKTPHQIEDGACTICGYGTIGALKIGLICLHDESAATDKNFIDCMYTAMDALGIDERQLLLRTGVAESDDCLAAAEDLIVCGCDIVIADSMGHESYLLTAARLHPDVLFADIGGYRAHTERLDNYINAYAAIHQGRYLCGVAAGLKLQESVARGGSSKVGFVGAYTYPEVISAYTAWFLGVRSVVPEATMEVVFTGSWYDVQAEKEAAYQLMEHGCGIISQYSDSAGAPTACEEWGVPNVSYIRSFEASCPQTYLIGCRIDWAPFYRYLVRCRLSGEELIKDFVGTTENGAVQLTALGNAAETGTQAKLDEVKAGLVNGTIKVFDTARFTVTTAVDGVVVSEPLTSYKADVDYYDFVGDTEAVVDGEFKESTFRSAPYFDVCIDGITLLNRNYGD